MPTIDVRSRDLIGESIAWLDQRGHTWHWASDLAEALRVTEEALLLPFWRSNVLEMRILATAPSLVRLRQSRSSRQDRGWEAPPALATLTQAQRQWGEGCGCRRGEGGSLKRSVLPVKGDAAGCATRSCAGGIYTQGGRREPGPLERLHRDGGRV